MTDESAMKLYQDGDPVGFDTLYQRHASRVYSYIKRRVPSEEEATEVYQEVFLKLHRSKELYNPSQEFLPWLYVITKSVCFDHLRKKKNSRESLYRAEDLTDLNAASSNKSALHPSLAHQVEVSQSGLNAEQKETLHLRFWEDQEFEEIAKKLGKSEVGVRKILSRAIQKMRTSIQKKEDHS